MLIYLINITGLSNSHHSFKQSKFYYEFKFLLIKCRETIHDPYIIVDVIDKDLALSKKKILLRK